MNEPCPSYRHRVDEPEPHLARRRELLRRHPELKELFGFSYLTSLVMLTVVVVQIVLAYQVQRAGVGEGGLGAWAAIVALAYFVGGTLNHWLGMGMHEAAHNLVARTERGNRVMALIANIPIPAPGAMSFRRHHLKHHSHLGIHPHDNDLAQEYEIQWVGDKPWRKFVWLVFYLFFSTLSRGFIKKLSRWELLNVALQLSVNAMLVAWVGWYGLAYLALSTFFGYGLHPVAGHFLHEHYIWREGQETYSYYGLLNWVNFNVGYHNEHHDLMWIPGWKLPQVKQVAPEFYDSLVSHRSWFWLQWHFIFNRSIGHDSRIARDVQTLRSKRIFSRTPGLSHRMMTREERAIEVAL